MGKELFKNIPSKVGDLVKDVRNGRIGLPDLQRPFALSAHISKKHRGMIEFVGQIRNAADHGADPDENNQVWTITNETASIYPCIIAALIKAIFLRDATGSIEV